MTAVSWKLVRRLMVIGAIVALPLTGYAQEATITGTVTDSTGGVLPGVTVTALHEASGNTFVGVTDERGRSAFPCGPGRSASRWSWQGFADCEATLDLLLGQTAVANLQMAPSTIQESVTVTGEAPLIDTTSSTVASNIDPLQMQELPVNGRNWMDLTMLAAGSRRTSRVRPRQGIARGTGRSMSTVSRCRSSCPAGPASRRGTAGTRSRNSSSSRTASMPPRAARPVRS